MSAHEVIAELGVEVPAQEGATARVSYVRVLRVNDDDEIVSLRECFGASNARIATQNKALLAFRRIERATMAWDADQFADAFLRRRVAVVAVCVTAVFRGHRGSREHSRAQPRADETALVTSLRDYFDGGAAALAMASTAR